MRTRGPRLWWIGLQALLASVIANLAVRWVALAAFDIAPEFPPLQGPGPVVFFTVVGVIAAVAVYATLGWLGRASLFQVIAIIALVLSLAPDVWMLTEAARPAFPGATVASVGTLMLMHVVAAVIVVRLFTGKGEAAL